MPAVGLQPLTAVRVYSTVSAHLNSKRALCRPQQGVPVAKKTGLEFVTIALGVVRSCSAATPEDSMHKSEPYISTLSVPGDVGGKRRLVCYTAGTGGPLTDAMEGRTPCSDDMKSALQLFKLAGIACLHQYLKVHCGRNPGQDLRLAFDAVSRQLLLPTCVAVATITNLMYGG